MPFYDNEARHEYYKKIKQSFTNEDSSKRSLRPPNKIVTEAQREEFDLFVKEIKLP